MRIIAGQLKGRYFDSPDGSRTHPMSDKVRGALFNVLGDMSGLSVLDAYAGSGALSFEAISRGAASVLAIDIDKTAYETMQANIAGLQLADQVAPLRKNIAGWSRDNQHQQFDVVLLDPPYHDIRPNVIERLATHVKPTGLMVLSWPGKEPLRSFKGLELIAHKNYGDASLAFYRRIS